MEESNISQTKTKILELEKKIATGVAFVDEREGIEKIHQKEIVVLRAANCALVKILLEKKIVDVGEILKFTADSLEDEVNRYERVARDKFGDHCRIGVSGMVDVDGSSISVTAREVK